VVGDAVSEPIVVGVVMERVQIYVVIILRQLTFQGPRPVRNSKKHVT
jgi:hypothetical protein